MTENKKLVRRVERLQVYPEIVGFVPVSLLLGKDNGFAFKFVEVERGMEFCKIGIETKTVIYFNGEGNTIKA